MRNRRRMGTICMILGTVLVLAALSLFFRNRQEDERAGESVDHLLPLMKEYYRRFCGTEKSRCRSSGWSGCGAVGYDRD